MLTFEIISPFIRLATSNNDRFGFMYYYTRRCRKQSRFISSKRSLQMAQVVLVDGQVSSLGEVRYIYSDSGELNKSTN